MPKIQQYHQTAIQRADPYDNPISVRSMGVRHHGAVRSVGVRHYGAVPNSGATAEVPDSRHRVFHKMGGSRSLSHHYGEEREKLHLEVHHMQVWDP